MPIFMTEAHGPGRIAFSRDAVGHAFAMHLHADEGRGARRHQFLAATDHVQFACTTVKGFKNLFWGGWAMIIDPFYCRNDECGL